MKFLSFLPFLFSISYKLFWTCSERTFAVAAAVSPALAVAQALAINLLSYIFYAGSGTKWLLELLEFVRYLQVGGVTILLLY